VAGDAEGEQDAMPYLRDLDRKGQAAEPAVEPRASSSSTTLRSGAIATSRESLSMTSAVGLRW
jgi:hypothetical protein